MEDARGRTAFHWALAGVFLPGVGLLAALVLAVGYRGGLWGRRLAALAVVDLLVLAALVGLATREDEVPAAPDGPRIGVMFHPDAPGRAVVRSVVAGWPAAEAGILAGDILQAIDGVATPTAADLSREIRGGGEHERTLAVEREGRTLEFKVTPRRPVEASRDLFEATPVRGGHSIGRRQLIGFGVAGAVVAAVWLVSRRRPGPRAWRGFFLASALFLGGSWGAVALLQILQGGLSRGGALVAMLLGHSCLGLGGLLAGLWLRADQPAEAPPPMGRWKALLLGGFYTLTCYPRAGVLFLGVDALFFGGRGKPSDALENFVATLHGPLGVALFVLAVAVVGPIAEEIVFRGQLLPRVAARLGRGGALAATSLVFGALHADYGLFAGLTVVLGWILGWTRLASGGLAAPILLHMLINGAVSAVFFWRRG